MDYTAYIALFFPKDDVMRYNYLLIFVDIANIHDIFQFYYFNYNFGLHRSI